MRLDPISLSVCGALWWRPRDPPLKFPVRVTASQKKKHFSFLNAYPRVILRETSSKELIFEKHIYRMFEN